MPLIENNVLENGFSLAPVSIIQEEGYPYENKSLKFALTLVLKSSFERWSMRP
jgi:hypothetical protein